MNSDQIVFQNGSDHSAYVTDQVQELYTDHHRSGTKHCHRHRQSHGEWHTINLFMPGDLFDQYCLDLSYF